MKKLQKHLTHKNILPFALLSLLITGCATTTKQEFEQYKNSVSNKDYTTAITTLESIIEKRPNNNQSFIRLHAMNYAMGNYGEYNLEKFTYWINRLGDEIGDTQIEFMAKDLNAARAYYEHNFNDASQFYTAGTSLCEKRKNLPPRLKEGDKNAPLYLVLASNCTLKKLNTKKGLTLHKVYLENIAQRENSASKALGIKLYLAPNTKLDNLNEEQRLALCELLSQIANTKIEKQKRSTPTLPPEAGKQMSLIFSLSESYNEKDWQSVMETYLEAMNTPGYSNAVKDTFSEVVLSQAYLMKRGSEMTVAMENLLKSSTHINIEYFKHMYLMGLSELGESKKALELYPTYLNLPITFQPEA